MDSSVVLNGGVFIGMFYISSFVLLNDFAAVGTSCTTAATYLNLCREDGMLLRHIKRTFLVSSKADIVKIVLRIVGASFLKDAIISTSAPDLFHNIVPAKLVEKIEKRTFDNSWIPDNAISRNVPGGIAQSLQQKTGIYRFGSVILSTVKTCGQLIQVFVVKVLNFMHQSTKFLTETSTGVMIFVGRSSLCTAAAAFLVALHSMQVALRTVRFVYNYFEYTLSVLCAVTNDCSLLTLEVVNSSVVNSGEDILRGDGDGGLVVNNLTGNVDSPHCR